jgi:hypothetical protein
VRAIEAGSGEKDGERVCCAAQEESLGGDVTDVACACPIHRVGDKVCTWAWRLRMMRHVQ